MNDEDNSFSPSGEASAKAQLERDVERLEATLNAERFCIIVAAVVLFDANLFKNYSTWSAPICLVAIELAGLFVLARRLKVDEIVGLTFEILKSWRGKRESDT